MAEKETKNDGVIKQLRKMAVHEKMTLHAFFEKMY